MNRTRTDKGSLVFGLFFLGIALWWAVMQVVGASLNLDMLGWLVAAALVTVGVVGVLSALRSGRDRHSDD